MACFLIKKGGGGSNGDGAEKTLLRKLLSHSEASRPLYRGKPLKSLALIIACTVTFINMFEAAPIAAESKAALYAELAKQARALLDGEHDRIANAANLSALAYQALPDLNWVGFYFFDGTELVLGPFQGKPACVRIALNRGVCGAAASQRQTQLVPDVHAFPGHIACDAASRSEIVVPLVHQGQLIGVWDVDSPVSDRFDEDDRRGMEALCEAFLASLR